MRRTTLAVKIAVQADKNYVRDVIIDRMVKIELGAACLSRCITISIGAFFGVSPNK
tara:strand:- start:2617 stop:2784 length:168 start_codon:yes stop_codon:yes gene_type:complete